MAKIPEEWSKHLTPEKRKYFENLGRELVENRVANKGFGPPEEDWAALAWLAEQRQKDGQRELVRFWLVLAVSILTLIAAMVGIAVTKGAL